MKPLKWENKFSVGVDLFDEQHKRLILIITQLLEFTKENEFSTSLENILKNLTDYSIYHFSSEEILMQKYDFPGFEAHKAEHQKFIARLGEFNKDFHENKMNLSLKIYIFLKDWLKGHIEGVDKEYTKFFQKHNIDKDPEAIQLLEEDTYKPDIFDKKID
ncbi:MAG: bacteriohemerythrin [Promethearchaeota archaeon]